MAELKEARVPDIGDYDGVPVIEVLVAVGDTVAKDQGLVTLESDKATMEVPAPFGGVVKELRIKVGDSVKEGSVVAVIESGDAASLLPSGEGARRADEGGKATGQGASRTPANDTPSPAAQRPLPQGEVKTSDDPKVEPVAVTAKPDNIAQASIDAQAGGAAQPATATATAASAPMGAGLPPLRFDAEALLPGKVPYASPAVRLFARELGVDLAHVTGSSRGGRISKEDVQGFVKGALAGGGAAAVGGASLGGLNIIAWPKVDFAKFGEVESKPLSRIKKLTGANLHRNWVSIPHVTNHEDADITELEALRVQLNKEAASKDGARMDGAGTGTKVTMLAFLVKACVAALQKFPNFNASLDGDNLVLKKYFHIGFAADTPNGLMVPVIRDADRKGVTEIAKEMGELAGLARDGKIKPEQMQGGCFSISSLGGIGGTYFTPIINAPEVAILGVCRSSTRPVWNGKEFAPRLILPLSLSWDHRVIDGAEAARFNAYLAQVLADFRRVLL
ncbi:MAG: dihydrolipoyllysine-residue acetyltransferase [Pseudomonadota bacterium]|nr:dihydrolipoyllysine-residue acetyltransferase [Pseudomonadota bacterium]